jgi:hypothetical protein
MRLSLRLSPVLNRSIRRGRETSSGRTGGGRKLFHGDTPEGPERSTSYGKPPTVVHAGLCVLRGLLSQVVRAHLRLELCPLSVCLQAPLSGTLSIVHCVACSGCGTILLGENPSVSGASILPLVHTTLHRPRHRGPGTSATAAAAPESLAETAADPRHGHGTSWHDHGGKPLVEGMRMTDLCIDP